MSAPESRQPVAAPGVAAIGILLALVLIAAGAIGVREALLAANAFSGPRWVAYVATHIDGLRPAAWMIPVGVIAVLVGLWWLLAALKPRRRREVALQGEASVWLRPAGIARMAGTTADSVAGTTTAQASANKRRVAVTITAPAAEAATLRTQVSEAISTRLAPTARTYSVKVKAKPTPDGGA